MADDADHHLSHLLIRKIQHPIISDSDAPSIAVPKLLAAARKSVVLQSEERLRDPRLHGCGKASQGAAACEEALRLKPGYELARNNLQYARARAKTPTK